MSIYSLNEILFLDQSQNIFWYFLLTHLLENELEMTHSDFDIGDAVTNSSRKNINIRIILSAKIILLGQNLKICLGENLPWCLEVLHVEFRDAPTNSKKTSKSIFEKSWVSRSKPKYFLVLFIYSLFRELAKR